MKKINLFYLMPVLLVFTVFYAVKSSSIFSMISSFVSILAVLILVLLIIKKGIKINSLLLIYLIYFIYNIILLSIGFSMTAMYKVFQELLLISFSFLLINITIPKDKVTKIVDFLSRTYYILLVFIIGMIIVMGSANFFRNYISMTILKVLFALSYFAFIKSTKKNIFLILSAALYFVIGERTPAIIFVLISFLYIVLGKMKSFNKYKVIFIFVVIGLFSFVVAYVSLPNTELGIKLNLYSRQLTGENFFSGRNSIWQQVFDATEENRLFGLTYNNSTELYYDGVLSTHNLYLWLLLNGGISLVALFIIYLYTIWKKYFKGLKNSYTRASAAYCMGFIILCNFELLLLINNFSVSMFMWFAIAFGLNAERNISDNNEILEIEK